MLEIVSLVAIITSIGLPLTLSISRFLQYLTDL